MPCAGSGQDAARDKAHVHEDRFQVRGETVLDTLSGALWTLDANPAGFPLTWKEAGDHVLAMASRAEHGQRNWQLPPRRLLFSLLSHQTVHPALPQGHPFRNVFSGYYWTADACHRIPDQVWHVHLGGARVARANRQDAALVWPVCLPDCPPPWPPGSLPPSMSDGAASPETGGERFIAREGWALDTLTGLGWALDAAPAGHALAWREALDFVNGWNSRGEWGASDWRMPDIRELESLVDLAEDSPALPGGHPFRQVRDVYWSSTTSVYEPRYAWALYMQDGMVGVGFKPDAGFHVWPVRDAR